MGDIGHCFDIEHRSNWVPNALAEKCPSIGLNSRTPGVQIGEVLHQADRDTELGEAFEQQVGGAAIQLRRCNNVIARTHQIQQRERGGSLSARGRDGGATALQGGDSVFNDRVRRIGNARIVVAVAFQAERCRGRFNGFVHKAGAGKDRRNACTGFRLGRGSGVDLQGVKAPTI